MITRNGLTRSILLVALSSGCALLPQTTHRPNTFYSLDRIPPQLAVAGVRGLPIGIDVVIPPSLDRKELVVRRADHRMEIRGTELWTAPFGPLVRYTLAADLASRLSDGMVILPGQTKPPGLTRSLDLTVEELAAGPEHSVTLDAHWNLREGASANLLLARHEHIVIDVDSLESGSVASGISRALGILADRIAAQLSAPTLS